MKDRPKSYKVQENIRCCAACRYATHCNRDEYDCNTHHTTVSGSGVCDDYEGYNVCAYCEQTFSNKKYYDAHKTHCPHSAENNSCRTCAWLAVAFERGITWAGLICTGGHTLEENNGHQCVNLGCADWRYNDGGMLRTIIVAELGSEE